MTLLTTKTDIYIIARCPLRHDHCVGMKRSFVGWLEKHRNEETSFELSLCPWSVKLEPLFNESCPHCGEPMHGKFCCAFPLED